MFPISQKQCLHKFIAVRCLSGRDLYSKLRERIPNDRGFIGSRNPATRQDDAMSMILDGFSNLKPIDKLPDDFPVTEPIEPVTEPKDDK